MKVSAREKVFFLSNIVSLVITLIKILLRRSLYASLTASDWITFSKNKKFKRRFQKSS